MLGYKDRRDVDNYFREFCSKGQDFLSFITRKSELSKYVIDIQEFVLANLFLAPTELYTMFMEKHQEIKMSQPTFNKYLTQMDTHQVLQHLHKCLDKNTAHFKNEHVITYLANNISESVVKKKIEVIQKEQKPQKSNHKATNMSLKTTTLCYLVMFLVGSGMSYDLISFVFGISKSYVYKLLRNIPRIDQMILESIRRWSGKLCVDEKFVKHNGKWCYVFSAVDFTTGIPLLVRYFENRTAVSWTLFFTEFKQKFSTPNLIVTDECPSIASGRLTVFSKVPFQCCKFHKMKNFISKIYEHEKDPEMRKLLINKLKQAFSRKTTGNRRKALMELSKIVYGNLKIFFQYAVLGQWKHLRKSLTSNTAERWNRKIKKIVSGKYGLKSPETIQLLINCLWFKEIIMNGQIHLSPKSMLSNLNISKICQEKISNKRMEHLFSIDKLCRAA